MDNHIKPYKHGVSLNIKLTPNAKTDSIGKTIETQNGIVLKIFVGASPEDDKALLRLLSKQLECRRENIELIYGSTNRNKVVYIKNVTIEQVEKLLL